MFITVFTPTYNRGYSLPHLYKSLCDQTCKDFEWLIVDDGSSDNTERLISDFINDDIIRIRYIRQPNGGKHRAINRGVSEAESELFFIVDSDDWLAGNAIERIIARYNEIKYDTNFAGVCGLRVYPLGHKVGGENSFEILDCTSLDFRYKYHVRGDMAEVIKTDILKKYPFPDIKGEKFCAESLIWNRIALKYKLRYFYERIYICEYLPDGLTARMTKNRHGSPTAACLLYSELSKMPIPLMQKIKAMINFWRFNSKKCIKHDKCGVNPYLSLLCYFPGQLLRLIDKYNNQL